jgi:hypothetical protein
MKVHEAVNQLESMQIGVRLVLSFSLSLFKRRLKQFYRL